MSKIEELQTMIKEMNVAREELEEDYKEVLEKLEEAKLEREGENACQCNCDGCTCDEPNIWIVADSVLNESLHIIINEDEFGYREIEISDIEDGDMVVLTIEELEAIMAMTRV